MKVPYLKMVTRTGLVAKKLQFSLQKSDEIRFRRLKMVFIASKW
ncbi:hypothetical protein [Caldifermentibacillus hisashii]